MRCNHPVGYQSGGRSSHALSLFSSSRWADGMEVIIGHPRSLKGLLNGLSPDW